MIWHTLSTRQREDLIRDMSRRGLTETQIETCMQAPDGAIRVIARRLGLIINKERLRKAAEAAPDPGAKDGGNMWAANEDRRRDMVARRAAKGAAEALRAFR